MKSYLVIAAVSLIVLAIATRVQSIADIAFGTGRWKVS